MNNSLRQYRKQANLTQSQVAQRVNVTSRTIISIEKGQYKPSLILAYKLATLFHTDIETLFNLATYVEAEKDEKKS